MIFLAELETNSDTETYLSRDPRGATKSSMKRLFDLTVSTFALLILFLPMLLIGLTVRLFLGSPILFSQERIGLNNKVFKIYKFRSMKDAKDSSGNELPDAVRLTAFGKILRASSLDELPELFNIIKGEMSLVGPRPLLTEYLPRYSKSQIRRHEVKPGLTGWAQVNGRNATTWPERFQLDVWYVDNWSFGLDLKIIFLTAFALLRQQGISANEHVTMPKFMGDSVDK